MYSNQNLTTNLPNEATDHDRIIFELTQILDLIKAPAKDGTNRDLKEMDIDIVALKFLTSTLYIAVTKLIELHIDRTNDTIIHDHSQTKLNDAESLLSKLMSIYR